MQKVAGSSPVSRSPMHHAEGITTGECATAVHVRSNGGGPPVHRPLDSCVKPYL
jgi:hypothetical protein